MLTHPYDQACQAYFAILAKTFPGDLMTRMVASVVGVLNFPFWQPEGHVPVGVTNPTLTCYGSVALRSYSCSTGQGRCSSQRSWH
jgi:hypothetical protein